MRYPRFRSRASHAAPVLVTQDWHMAGLRGGDVVKMTQYPTDSPVSLPQSCPAPLARVVDSPPR
jgi:hypothetical protein